MNPELAKARQHYDTLPPHVKERATAKHLLAVIQIAERNDQALAAAKALYDEINSRFGSPLDMGKELRPVMAAMEHVLARVSKPEGE